jgi:hypothetical protein
MRPFGNIRHPELTFRDPNSGNTKGVKIGKPKIVVIDGGTGTYTALMGLKCYDADLTAVVPWLTTAAVPVPCEMSLGNGDGPASGSRAG